MLKRVGWFLLAGVLLVGGCTATTAPELEDAPPLEGEPFTLMQEAPDTVPVVALNGVELETAQFAWWVGGERVSQVVTNPADVVIAEVPTAQGLNFSFDAATAPSDLVLTLYSELGDDGFPLESSATMVDCGEELNCLTTVENRGLVAFVDNVPGTVAGMLQAAYTVSLKSEDPAIQAEPINYASWTFRLIE